MTFSDALKEMKLPESCVVPTDELGYWNFNITFFNKEKQYDQTQLDVYPYRFDYIQRRCDELNELWKDFCKENSFKQNSIISIELVVI